MADEDVLKLRLEGDDQILLAFRKIGEAGQTAFRRVSDSAQKTEKDTSKASASVIRNLEGITNQFGVTGRAAQSLGRAVETAFQGLGPAGTAFAVTLTAVTAAAVAATTAFFKLAESGSKVAESVKEGAAATGQTVEDYQRLNFAISLATKGAANMDTVFNRLNSIIADAGDESNATTKKFKELGVRLVDGGGKARSAQDIFLDLADSVGRLDAKTRTATLIGIFGPRQGGLFASLLAEGSAGIRKLTADADRLNIVLTKAETQVGDDFGDAFIRLNKSIEITRSRIGLLFAPTFTRGANALAEFIADNQATIVRFGEVVARVFDDVFKALTGDTENIQSSFLYVIGRVLKGLAVLITGTVLPVLGQLKVGLETAFAGINKLFGTNISISDFAIVGIMLAAVKVFGLFLTALRAVAGALGILRIAALAVAIPLSPMILLIGAAAAAVIALGVAIATRVDWSGLAARGAQAVQSLMAAWTAFVAFFTQIWLQIGIIASTAWLAVTNGVNLVLTQLRIMWTGFAAFLTGIFNAIAQAGAQVWALVSEGAGAAVAAIMAAWQGFAEFFMSIWTPIVEFTSEAYQAIIDGTTALTTGLTELWQSFVDKVIGFFTQLRDFIISVWEKVKGIIEQLLGGGEGMANGGEAGGKGGKKMARGGPVSGPGSSTGDRIRAWLSDGEFVTRARAVQYYGAPLFHALNNMRLDPEMFSGLGGLSMPRSTPKLAYADGGMVNGGGGAQNILNLTIGDQQFKGLQAPEDTMENLRKYATSRGIRSAGRKPGWYGGQK